MKHALIDYCAAAITPGWGTASRITKDNARITAQVVLEAAKLPRIGELIDFAIDTLEQNHHNGVEANLNTVKETLHMAREMLLGEDIK